MGQCKRYFFVSVISITMILVSIIVVSPSFSADDEELPKPWNEDWKYHQKIRLPIKTDTPQAQFQPIDIRLTLKHPCWGINETVHSVRVVCWNTSDWDELDVQLYNIEKSDETTISSCNIVFLIPSYASGEETYFVFYDDQRKKSPKYPDHVQLFDKYYYFEPITGISVEGDYYEIKEDDNIVYGVGQKGRVLNRCLSQIAIRMKPETKKFDMLRTDLLASFCFAYQQGFDDEDEVASDQDFVAKEILVDGNLMVRFRVVSQSSNKELYTSNIYTYYYQPGEDKRISVTVHHEIRDDLKVSGIKNVDGRFGTIISYHSKSPSMEKMAFGEILPYLYVSSEEGLREYSLEIDPESSEREWIISYEDDCDLGPEAWIAYGNGESGKTHGLIFSSNNGIVQNASDERDGIEIKLAEKEYLDVIGAEVDYASIAFGRNAFETHQKHDLHIEQGMEVTFDVEFYTTYDGGYKRIEQESTFFQTLVALRDVEIGEGEGAQNIYTLTVVPHLSGRLFSFPLLRNITGLRLPVITGELYQNQTVIAESIVEKPFIGFQTMKFPKLSPGNYEVKIYRLLPSGEKSYIGFGFIQLQDDVSLHVYCTWEQGIEVSIKDQFGHGISDVSIEIWQGHSLVATETSQSFPRVRVPVPFNLFKPYMISSVRNATVGDIFQLAQPYVLKAYYKGFKVFNATFSTINPTAEITFSIHDVIIEVTDGLGLPPDIKVVPSLTSRRMDEITSLKPSFTLEPGRFQFHDIPQGSYKAHISYAGYTNEKVFSIPDSGSIIPLEFLAHQSLDINVLTSRGEAIESSNLKVRILRDNEKIGVASIDETIMLPPGTYVLSVLNNDELIGSDIVELTSDKTIPVVTIIPSIIYLVVTFTAIILLAEIILFFYFKKISLNTALKLVILGVVLVGVMQPWWTFYGESDDGSITKTSQMYLYPSSMIEEYTVDDTQYLSLATIPEVFTDFIHTLLVIIGVGLGLLLASFIPNLLLHKRFAFLLAGSGVIFMLLVSAAFFIGMNQIAQLSLGSLQGSSMIPISPPYHGKVMVSASWGLGPGFFIVFFGAGIAVFAGVLDYFKKHQTFTFLKNRKQKKQIKKQK